MVADEVHKVESSWSQMTSVLFVPHSEQEYRQLVAVADQLVDALGEDESHPLASLLEVVGVLIEKYEDEHVPEITTL